MGITISRYCNNNNNSIHTNECLICWDKINTTANFTKCLRCNIVLHSECETIYRGVRDWCKCPHCQRVGSLGTIT